jgi:hypothetical protein
MMGPSDEERRSIAARPYRQREREAGRLPESGAPSDQIYTQQNLDYPADTDICFARGNGITLVRLTTADRGKLLAAVGTLVPELEMLRSQALDLVRNGVPEEHGKGLANTAVAVVSLVNQAHAAGYRLADEDHRETYQDAAGVREFLQGKLEEMHRTEELAFGEIGPGPEVRALERVIAMLEGK